jgi:hypothetical protein
MYTTIEADIENGVVCGADSSRLPAHAHVLITLLSVLPNEISEFPAKSEGTPILARTPNPAICGKIKLLGDIMDTVPVTSWNLPS